MLENLRNTRALDQGMGQRKRKLPKSDKRMIYRPERKIKLLKGITLGRLGATNTSAKEKYEEIYGESILTEYGKEMRGSLKCQYGYSNRFRFVRIVDQKNTLQIN